MRKDICFGLRLAVSLAVCLTATPYLSGQAFCGNPKEVTCINSSGDGYCLNYVTPFSAGSNKWTTPPANPVCTCAYPNYVQLLGQSCSNDATVAYFENAYGSHSSSLPSDFRLHAITLATCSGDMVTLGGVGS